MKKILAINQGATSTKFAVFANDQVLLKKTVEHQGNELNNFPRIYDQQQYRLGLILAALDEANIAPDSFDAIVGRGGLLKPLAGGTYAVNNVMIEDLKKSEEHASKLGGLLGYTLGQQLGIPAYIVDPVSVDELEPVARVSGSPEFVRISMSHALNMKAVARKVAANLRKKYAEAKLIVAHLGTGVTLSVHKGGKMIDIVDGREEGPFSPDRCGGLPVCQLIELCYSGKYTFQEMRKKVTGSGGLFAYLGTRDIRQVEKLAAEGNEQAEILLQALAYQVSKEIGALAAVVAGDVDQVVLTGGMAYSSRIVNDITTRVTFIAPVSVVPGEEELESLAAGALRVLNGEEPAKCYE